MSKAMAALARAFVDEEVEKEEEEEEEEEEEKEEVQTEERRGGKRCGSGLDARNPGTRNKRLGCIRGGTGVLSDDFQITGMANGKLPPPPAVLLAWLVWEIWLIFDWPKFSKGNCWFGGGASLNQKKKIVAASPDSKNFLR